MTEHVNVVAFLGPLLKGINFSLVSVAIVLFLRNRDVGHRRLMSLLLFYCVLQALTAYQFAWGIWFHHVVTTATWFNLMTSMVGLISIMYFLWNSQDVLFTLKESEYANRLRSDHRSDMAQARINTSYISEQNLEHAQHLLRRASSLSVPAR